MEGNNKQESIEELIYEMSYRIRLFREKRGKKIGELTEYERLILEILDRWGSLNISEVNNHISLSSSSISTIITNLSKMKLLEKTKPENNQRTTLVNLTKEGNKKLKDLRNEQLKVFGFIKTSLNLTPEKEKVIREAMSDSIKFFDAFLG